MKASNIVINVVGLGSFGMIGAIVGFGAFFELSGGNRDVLPVGLVVGGLLGASAYALYAWYQDASLRRHLNSCSHLFKAALAASQLPSGDTAFRVYRSLTAQTLGRAVSAQCLLDLQEHGLNLVSWLRVALAERRQLSHSDWLKFQDGVKRILDKYPHDAWSLAKADSSQPPRNAP